MEFCAHLREPYLGFTATRSRSDSLPPQQPRERRPSSGQPPTSPQLCIFLSIKRLAARQRPRFRRCHSCVWSAFPLIPIRFPGRRRLAIHVRLWVRSWGDFVDCVWTFVLSVPRRSPDEWKGVQRHLCAGANCWLQHFAVVPHNCCVDKVDQLSSEHKVGLRLLLELNSQRRRRHHLQLFT